MIFNLNSFTQKGGGENNVSLIIAIIVIIIFFIFIMPNVEKCYNDETKKVVEELENIMNTNITIDTNKCSKSCCINSGWPLPKELQPNDMTTNELTNYIPTNFSCNLGSNTGGGCVCVTKNDYENLGNRGNNGIVRCNN